MVAADPFDRDDFSGTQGGDSGGQRGFIAVVDFLSHHELQMRTAHRAGNRLGMKAAVERVFVFTPAIRAQGEIAHRGVGTIVGQGGDQRVARTALSTVDEGIAVAAVGRVVQFGQAVGTDESIDWQMDVGGRTRLAVEDGKRFGVFGRAGGDRERAGGRQRRRLAQQRMAESL